MSAPTYHEQRHALAMRIAHWLVALAVIALIGSGWRIYNASPIFGFAFPVWLTLGGDVEIALARDNDPGVANALAWHFAAMWVLAFGYLLFIFWGLLSGHFLRDFLPVRRSAFLRDFALALRFRLGHRLGEYNAVQKAFYWGALALLALMLVSGLAIWKPVQTYPLELAFGGFQGARLVHFLGMSAIVLFLVVHLALVALVPRTLLAMLAGRAREPVHTLHRSPP